MKNIKLTVLSGFSLMGAAQAQMGGLQGGVMLGGGYLEDPGKAYGFFQLRGTFYEDDAFAHSAFFEYLGHTDDAVLEFALPGGGRYFEDGDILFSNLTVNYELEAKLDPKFSVFVGAGLGVELISLDDRFNFSIDSDSNFLAQTFAGVRYDFGGVFGQLGIRYLFRDDFRLLGDQFVTEDSAAYELSVGFQF